MTAPDQLLRQLPRLTAEICAHVGELLDELVQVRDTIAGQVSPESPPSHFNRGVLTGYRMATSDAWRARVALERFDGWLARAAESLRAAGKTADLAGVLAFFEQAGPPAEGGGA